MPVGYSFSASFRWTPRYNLHEVVGQHFPQPVVKLEYDPSFLVDFTGQTFARPVVGMVTVIVDIGSIGTDNAGVQTFPRAYAMMQSVVKPIGSIGTDNAGTQYFPRPVIDMKAVAVILGSIGTDNAGAQNFPRPITTLAPP